MPAMQPPLFFIESPGMQRRMRIQQACAKIFASVEEH
jgi:hypothetical protein